MYVQYVRILGWNNVWTEIELFVILFCFNWITRILIHEIYNFRYPCNSTAMCRNWTAGPNLQCLTPLTGGSIKQCLCTPSQYFDYCADLCYTAKGYQQACNISSCYATSMCDPSKSLSCINNLCNCTNTEWWNTTSCVPKGSLTFILKKEAIEYIFHFVYIRRDTFGFMYNRSEFSMSRI